MNQKTKDGADRNRLLVSGLALLLLGIGVFIPSVLSYAHFLDEDKAMKDKAASQGIGDIPGVNLAGTISFFLALTIIGGLMSVAGGGLMLAATLGSRGTKGTGANPRKSQE